MNRIRLVTRAAIAVGSVVAMTLTLSGAGALEGRPRGQRTAVSAAAEANNIRQVGFSNLGGGGLNGQVAVLGDIAIVGAGVVSDPGGWHNERFNPFNCLDVTAKIVDISDPANPTVISTIAVPTGSAAIDVDALRVATPSFTGDLLAVALEDGPSLSTPTRCNPSQAFRERGVAYYNITDPAAPEFLGRYQADADRAVPADPPCGPPPEGGSVRCATGQHSVDLVQRPDGKVLSVSTEPVSTILGYPSSDIRIVDVTAPTNPVQVASWPPADQRRPLSSVNGCRPNNAGHDAVFNAAGNRLFAAYMDDGLFSVDVSNESVPTAQGQWDFAEERAVEGNAAYVEFARIGKKAVALVAEEDLSAPTSSIRVDSPASIAGSKPGCEAMWTLHDLEEDAQVFRAQGRQISGEIVYVGRSCPERVAAGTLLPADPYLADATGKIALVDAVRNTATQPGIAAAACRHDLKVAQAQRRGATGVILIRIPAPPFSPTGQAVAIPGDGSQAQHGDLALNIPMVQVDDTDGIAMRNVLCPSIDGDGNCQGGQQVNGALVDGPGRWGGLRIIDVSDPAAPQELGSYESPNASTFPPPDLGIYAVQHAVSEDKVAYVAANSDGLRVLDVSDPSKPVELASFVPEDTADPTNQLASKAYVVDVALAGGRIVISDINSGLYVLKLTPRQHARSVSLDLSRHLVAMGKVAVADGFSACRSNLPVEIQRRTASGWKTVAKDRTNSRGNFRKALPDKPGRYRAKATKVAKGVDRRDVCRTATSSVRRHRH